jgi:hypothetical protein
MSKRLAVCCLLLLFVVSTNGNAAPEDPLVIVVNKSSGITTLSKLDLYKIYSCTDTKRTGTCIEPNESQLVAVEQFLKMATDDSDMTYVKFKTKNYTRIRKRELIVIKMYNKYEEILTCVKENKNCVGFVPKSMVSDEVMVCDIK